jgi:hypothetical protein
MGKEVEILREEVMRLRRDVTEIRRTVGTNRVCLIDREGRRRSIGETSESGGEIFAASANGTPRAGFQRLRQRVDDCARYRRQFPCR